MKKFFTHNRSNFQQVHERKPMSDYWEVCDEFPRYCISPEGEVRRNDNDLVKQPSVNQNGILYMSLYDPRTRTTSVRSVASLVARAYTVPDSPDHDTVVHIDGDRTNVHASNLMWRRREFAIAYHKEMSGETKVRDYRDFYCIGTGERFGSVFELAKDIGALPSRISRSIFMNDKMTLKEIDEEWYRRTIVWPTGDAFRSTIY